MGSGSSNIYSGTGGGSQPYAEKYSVYSKMLSIDKKDPDIYDPTTGYFKNPTAVNLNDCIDGNRFVFSGHRAEGTMTYVMDSDGNIIFGKRSNPNDARKRAPHPTLIGGKDPKVQCAGMIVFKKGRILSVDNQSGHFRPDLKSLNKVNDALQKLCDENPNLFDKDSIWRKK
ncbi:MAG: hypothetical protein IKQ27_00185 [Lachnospiraceae bacterium]|nr:hypothetical protein [Solobacterium sp.]MBR6155348.1 hypothetical protein [Lachnospiraceae bacterium]